MKTEQEKMRIHYLQHVPFEGPASIEHWATARGHAATATKFYRSATLPDIQDFDRLIVMGGPMNIHEDDAYPWLAQEKVFIRKAIGAGKTVVGICLGAQLIADVLGAAVYRNEHKEIGWFPIELTPYGRQSEIFGFLPERFTVFHWHGDTFTLPTGAVHLARSEGCENQAFLHNGRVLGLQFHLESTEESMEEIIKHCRSEITEAKYVQSASEMRSVATVTFQRINEAMFGLLDRLSG